MIIEKLKSLYNKVESSNLYYFRDNVGNEVDLIQDYGQSVSSFEIKSSKTLSRNLFKGLEYYQELNSNNNKATLIYTGTEKVKRYGFDCLPYGQF